MMTESSTEQLVNRQLAILKLILHKTMALVPDIDKGIQLEIYKQVNQDLRTTSRKKIFIDKKQKRLF